MLVCYLGQWGLCKPGNLSLDRGVDLKPIKKTPVIALLSLFLVAAFVAAKSAPEVLFQDSYSGAGELGGHVADVGGGYSCNESGRAQVGGGQVTFFGGGTFSEQEGAHNCALVDENDSPLIFKGGELQSFLRLFPTSAPGTVRSTFVEYKLGSINRITATRGIDNQMWIHGIFDDSDPWVVNVPDHDKEGTLRIVVNPKSREVTVWWESRPDQGFVLLPSGKVVNPEFQVEITSGGGGDTFINPDAAIEHLVVTEWQKEKKEKKPKKDKKEKSK